ncbi:MAG: HEAT repeat domain-containing protein [Pirellulaceae bacterium]
MLLVTTIGNLLLISKQGESGGCGLFSEMRNELTLETFTLLCYIQSARCPRDRSIGSCFPVNAFRQHIGTVFMMKLDARMRNQTLRTATARLIVACVVLGVFAVTSGCHDGPLYALKHVNPYFTMKEWRDEEQLGVTDHERRQQLLQLADTIESLPAQRQAYWSTHLSKMIELDPSPEMRRLAVSAAGKLRTGGAVELIQKGLDDDSIKVRMEACRALGNRREAQAATLLASTYGSETEIDVKHAALDAMANHKGPTAINSLRNALNDRNPATQSLAMQSLRGVTGKDYGSNPDAWLKAIGVPEFAPTSPSGIGAPPNAGPAVQIAQEGLSFPGMPADNSGGSQLR